MYFSSFPGPESIFTSILEKIRQKMNGKPKDVETLEDQKLVLIPGQRGCNLLVLDHYTFSKNNQLGDATYWCCRQLNSDKEKCRARVRTLLQLNGLYTVTLSQPNHNHPPNRVQKPDKEDYMKYMT